MEEGSSFILAHLLQAFTSADLWYYIINGGVLLLLLLTSALVSGSEVAFFSLNASDIVQCKESKEPAENRVAGLLTDPKRLLATILIFNNFVNVGIVTLSSFLCWKIFGKDNVAVLFVVNTVLITFLIVFFGEVIPKVYANQKNLNFAVKTSSLIAIASFIFKPVAYVLVSFTSLIERRIQKKGYEVSVEELTEAVELATSDQATDEQKEILKGIVNFSTINAKQVMQSRMDITALEYSLDFHQLMDKINKSSFSRIPIYEERVDKIRGILHVKDVLPHIDREENFEWQNLLREAYFVPETKMIDDLLKDFQEKRVHMAIVVDEYGGISGLVTLEDIIEEIVGEINDEFDVEADHYTKVNEDTYLFEGKISLHDFCKVMDVKPDLFDDVKGESESLGGLLLELNSSMPKAGDKVEFEDFDFVIQSVNTKRIKKVKVIYKKVKDFEFED